MLFMWLSNGTLLVVRLKLKNYPYLFRTAEHRRWCWSVVRVRPTNLLLSTGIRFTINSDFALALCMGCWVFAKCQDRFSYYIHLLLNRRAADVAMAVRACHIYLLIYALSYVCDLYLARGSHNRHIQNQVWKLLAMGSRQRAQLSEHDDEKEAMDVGRLTRFSWNATALKGGSIFSFSATKIGWQTFARCYERPI